MIWEMTLSDYLQQNVCAQRFRGTLVHGDSLKPLCAEMCGTLVRGPCPQHKAAQGQRLMANPYMRAHMHACAHIHAHMHACMPARPHARMRCSCTCARLRTLVHACIHIMHKRAFMHICMHACMHGSFLPSTDPLPTRNAIK